MDNRRQFFDKRGYPLSVGSIVIYTWKTSSNLSIGVIEKLTPKGVSIRSYNFIHNQVNDWTDSITEFYTPWGSDKPSYSGIKVLSLGALKEIENVKVVKEFELLIEKTKDDG